MKIVIGEMPVLTFRVVIAWGSGIVILAIAALSGSKFRLHRRDIGPAMLAAALSISGWFYLSTLALTMMPAGRASVLAYTMPLWAFLARDLADRRTGHCKPRSGAGLRPGHGAGAYR